MFDGMGESREARGGRRDGRDADRWAWWVRASR